MWWKKHICVCFVTICQATRSDDWSDFVLLHLRKDKAPHCDHWDQRESLMLQQITLTPVLRGSWLQNKTRVPVALSRKSPLSLLSSPQFPNFFKRDPGNWTPLPTGSESPQLREHICFTSESSSVFMTIDLLSLSLCNMFLPHLATSNNSCIFLHETLWAKNLGAAQGCHSPSRSLMQTWDHYFLPLILIPFLSIHAYF